MLVWTSRRTSLLGAFDSPTDRKHTGAILRMGLLLRWWTCATCIHLSAQDTGSFLPIRLLPLHHRDEAHGRDDALRDGAALLLLDQ